MSRQDQIIKERIRKIKELKDQGINPFPYSFSVDDYAADLQKKFKTLEKGKRNSTKVSIAGRLMTYRDFGKIAFGVLNDSSGTIQITLQKGETPDSLIQFFKKYVDTGDILGISGTMLRTQRGELSVLVKNGQLLSKSLLPLPEKWHGLQDKEERYRKRHLDLIMNPEIKEVFDKREKIVDYIRFFMKQRGYKEVDTPYLQTVYGGANATPFQTHLNTLDMKLYLSISPELFLKRLIIGGYDKVFTIARNFRNEGIDRWHNPEFTMMESYEAYADYNTMMTLTEELFDFVIRKLNGTTKVKFKDVVLDFKKPWKRMTMSATIKKYAGINVMEKNESELKSFVKKNKVKKKGDTWGWLVQSIFEHYCEAKILQPTFIIDHPVETTPLCKLLRSDKTRRLIERFEPFCMGIELGNAYSELNDPQRQKELFEEQIKQLKNSKEVAHPHDADYVNALASGMPPTGGLGIGIDRMTMLFTGQESIRDVILFPFMKPLNTRDK